jgi:phytoene desaturase
VMAEQKQKRAVIIGGGLGGLALALRLSVGGWRVTVCERNSTFGGKMNKWCSAGFQFDTGPSLITMPAVFRELYRVAGTTLEEHLELVRIQPLAEYHFDDGARLIYSTMLPEWLETLRAVNPRDVDGFLRFMNIGARLYEVSRATFFEQSPFSPLPRLDLGTLKRLPIRYGWGNYARTVDAHFKSPYLRQLYNRYPTYVGSSPYQSPATLMVVPYIEYALGGWYVKGGLYKIVESLLRLARERDVTLLANSHVAEILQTNRRVTGVELADGTQIAADVVVMNGDASTTALLLGEESRDTLAPSRRSLSGVVFLLGTRSSYPSLCHHAVHFSRDYREEFRQLFEERRFPDDPTVYVNVASRTDRAIAGNQGEALFIMANAPANGDETWDGARTRDAWDKIMARLRGSGFPIGESDIVVKEAWTPSTFAERYCAPGGSIYGQHSHGWRNAFLRPPNKDRRYRGLYYVGGSSHPGGGTPMVLLSAKITESLIRRYEDE